MAGTGGVQFRGGQHFRDRNYGQRGFGKLSGGLRTDAGRDFRRQLALYISNFGSNNIAVYDIDLGKIIAYFPSGRIPTRWAFRESELSAGARLRIGRLGRNSESTPRRV